ncbi:hypothetical protein [uncultured Microbulbifer sp.]|uniref:hypothetical protein n=1 Tax=uncultured Microbulbifer sp. TaxID=348147 RepID=UPI002610F0D0|nr:hypothetical protein [uncultured Microbulbifer sp.]
MINYSVKEMESDKTSRKAYELKSSGKLAEALKLYSKLAASSDEPRYHMAYALCLQDMSHWKQSIEVLTKAIDLNPPYCLPDAQLSLAVAYLKVNSKKKAIKLLKVCADRPPEYPSYETLDSHNNRHTWQ